MLDGHTQDVKCVKWHPKLENVLFSTSYDDTVKIWTEDAGDWYCASSLEAHNSTVWSCTLSSSGNQLVTCSDDKSLVLWECEDPDTSKKWNVISTLKNFHDYTIYSVDWNSHSSYVVSAGGDNAIKVCSLDYDAGSSTLREICHVREAHAADVNCVRYFVLGV